MPAVTVCDDGVAEIEKSLTVSVTWSECERLPLVPVTVSVYVPAGVLDEVVTVSVELPEPVTEVGLKVPLAPVGKPLTLNDTLLLKPLMGLMVVV